MVLISISERSRGDNIVSATELDSHANLPVVGRYARILETTHNTALVSGITSDLGKPIRVPIVITAVAYDCKYTVHTYTMVIHNALFFNNMTVNLIPPMMMRIADLEINECPKFLSKNP